MTPPQCRSLTARFPSWVRNAQADPRRKTDTPYSMVLQQNARSAAAALLPPLTHLPPTMVLPGKETVQKVLNGKQDAVVQNQKSGEE